MFIDKLYDIINKYNNKYHSTIKMKSVDVKSNTCINSSKEISDKDPKFKIGDTVRTWKCKNIFVKGHVSNWSAEVFAIKKKNKTLCREHKLLVILKAKKLLERFMKKNWIKLMKKSLELKKVKKRKGDKLYFKWKGYESSFNSWIYSINKWIYSRTEIFRREHKRWIIFV